MAITQDRLKAYLELIQILLSCPSGEEWILLRQNEHLVSAEFIQVMEQVATQVAAEGHAQSGTFLHNLAAQLHHILLKNVAAPSENVDQDRAYQNLIQALIDRPQQAADLMTANSDLIGPELVHLLKLEAAQMMGRGDQKTAHFLKNLAEELNRVWLEAHAFKPPSINKNSVEKVPQTELPTAEPSESILSKPQADAPKSPGLKQVVSKLDAIATCLIQLNEYQKVQQQDPLWYLDALEKAASSDWLLSTTEVERLIGVKPHCKADGVYQRGQWLFNKAGKIGTQTAWQVKKASIN